VVCHVRLPVPENPIWAARVVPVPPVGDAFVPIILIILLAILILQAGFWKALGAVLGAAAMVALFVLILAAVIAIAGYLLFDRVRRRF
jgi:hypothetical protein